MRPLAPTGFVIRKICAAAIVMACWVACSVCCASVLPRAPRETHVQLRLAQNAVAEGRFSEAFLLMDGLLAGSQNGFLAAAASDGVQRPVQVQATALLASLPPKQLLAWEAWCGVRAREALGAAVRRRDRRPLVGVALRFPWTAAGEEAAFLLACDSLDRNRPLEAQAWLRRLARHRVAGTPFGVQITLLTALAYLLDRQEGRAAETLAQLPSTAGQVRLRIGDEEIAADDSQRLMLALAAAVQPLCEKQPAAATGWTTFRGNPARNAASDWPGTVDRLLWKVDAATSLPQQQAGAAVPAGQPLIAGSLVLARSSERLIAIDAPTGRQLWEYPWGGNSPAPQGAAGNLRFALVVPQDASLGQMTVDDKRLFLTESPSPSLHPLAPSIATQACNRLVALSLVKEGKLLWSVGAASGEDEPALAGAFFLGPPLLHEARLHVLAEIDAEVCLCTLDAATGSLEWSLPLAAPEPSIANDPQRRLAGATPSMAHGVLVCPTSAGAVVAVDLATRTILWGYSYPVSADRTRALQFQVLRMAGQNQRPATSIDATATLVDRHVLLAPVESDELLCLDLFSGNLVWSRAMPGLLYVGCVTGETVVTVCETSVSAWHLHTGKPAWPELATHLPDEAKTSGRGVLVGRSYFLPTSEPGLLRFHTSTGRIELRLPLPETVGNLVAVGPLLVSQSAGAIHAFTAVPPAVSARE